VKLDKGCENTVTCWLAGQFLQALFALIVWGELTYCPDSQLVSAVHTFFVQVVAGFDSNWSPVHAGLQWHEVPHS
jgi:hypothetical protein